MPTLKQYSVHVVGKWGGSRSIVVSAGSTESARKKAAALMRVDERVDSVRPA